MAPRDDNRIKHLKLALEYLLVDWIVMHVPFDGSSKSATMVLHV